MSDETTTEQLVEIEGQGESTPVTGYTPPEGWRVLAVGERLRDGDVIVRKDGSRYPAERLGGWVGSNQRHIRLIEPEPQPQPQPVPEPNTAAIEELRSEVSYVQRLLGESRQRVTQLEELVASLRTINEGAEKAIRAAGQQNIDLQHRLDVVSKEWADQAAISNGLQAQLDRRDAQIRDLQIELDALQQAPQAETMAATPPATEDRFEQGWDAGTARAVETIAEWTEPLRTCGSQALALAVMANLPHIMRTLTGLTQED